MRWSNLETAEEERTRLPGYRDEAVIRHFDAPEAIETRFYEVRARSILNHVPDASQMPFRWTINPYRGCTHACAYCVSGETPVLMGDGRHRPISELEVGESIYGTISIGSYRRYTVTSVLNKWISLKPAFRVALEDGTEFIASGDHRFLTDRGWKHVTNTPDGLRDRPHLTTNNFLVGTGAFADQPTESRDYRRGYLCGIVRGDGHIGSYEYFRRERRDQILTFRLALADFDALRRARGYLELEEVEIPERLFKAASAGHREMRLISTARASMVERVTAVIAWPILPSLDWCRGFLAGIYDAEGSNIRGVLRISNQDAQILAWTEACARRLGFDVVLERQPGRALCTLRVRGGLAERLRFLHTTDPAITRKRSLEGFALKGPRKLRVAAVEPLGRSLPLYDITTGTGDFIANGVVSHNCFARPTHTYLDFNAGRDFEREIVVKVNAPELLRAELARPSWKGEHVALGTNTDPYQWVEGRYKLMRGIWEAFRDAANPCSVLTKSPLLLRDLDLMQELSERTEFSAALSVPTLDEGPWRATEPRTPHPRARLEAVTELTHAGIRTGILVAPLMPGINDAPEQVAPILEAAREAGAAYVTGIGLHLRKGVREVFFEWLEEERPELVERYRRMYGRGAYLPLEERRRLSSLVRGPDLSPGQRMRGSTVPRQVARKPERAQKEVQERLF